MTNGEAGRPTVPLLGLRRVSVILLWAPQLVVRNNGHKHIIQLNHFPKHLESNNFKRSGIQGITGEQPESESD